MKVGIISVFTDYHRRGAHHRGGLQPQIGPLIAALLPEHVEVEIVNDTWDDPDWSASYDLLFLSSLHSDFDRARHISHYFRRRGTKTVLGGPMASMYPKLCAPYFDAIVVGDPESTVPLVYRDFCGGRLAPIYRSTRHDPDSVPTPRFDLVRGRLKIPIALEASRGCPFTCEFCSLTGLGTRYHTRAADRVVRDIRAAQRMLRGRVPWPQRRMVGFMDNNIGGNPRWLGELCDALAPLGVRWSSCITFNVLQDDAMLDRLAASGCGMLYFGLESFNESTLDAMHKRQNELHDVRRVVDGARRRGILVTAGLMLAPRLDRIDDILRIPERLVDVGIHMPTYIAFETPIPGTPTFRALAASDEPPLLPNVPLADLNGYALAMRPVHASPEEFVGAFKAVHARVYSKRVAVRKLADDLPRLLAARSLTPALVDAFEVLLDRQPLPADRTFIAGTDKPPPERVPLGDDDFDSEQERDAITKPWMVSDGEGRILPQWLGSKPIFAPKGRILPVS